MQYFNHSMLAELFVFSPFCSLSMAFLASFLPLNKNYPIPLNTSDLPLPFSKCSLNFSKIARESIANIGLS